MDKEDLLELKDKIGTAKSKESEAKGELKAIHKNLKKDWECKTPKEAQALVASKKEQRKEIKKKIEKGTKKIQKKLNNET